MPFQNKARQVAPHLYRAYRGRISGEGGTQHRGVNAPKQMQLQRTSGLQLLRQALVRLANAALLALAKGGNHA